MLQEISYERKQLLGENMYNIRRKQSNNGKITAAERRKKRTKGGVQKKGGWGKKIKEATVSDLRIGSI